MENRFKASRANRRRLQLSASLAAALAAGTMPLLARVIPYAPVMPFQAVPTVQKRAARHAVLQEVLPQNCLFDCVQYASRLVIQDSLGLEPPRDVTPGGTTAWIQRAAAWEGDDGSLRLLTYGVGSSGGSFLYSGDGGRTWSVVPLPEGAGLNESDSFYRWYSPNLGRDIGGPISGGTSSPVRLGTAEVPFVLSIGGNISQPGFWAVRADGSAFCLSEAWAGALLGSDAGGSTFLVGAYDFQAPSPPYTDPTSWQVATLDVRGRLRPLFETSALQPWMEGWITPFGAVYLNVDWEGQPIPEGSRLTTPRSVAFWEEKALFEVAGANEAGSTLFAVPTSDFAGAWIVKRDASATVLSSRTEAGVRVAWDDPARPDVEAIHVGSSGGRLLVQSTRHRDVQGDDVTGLAVWEVGRPAPSRYDSLVMFNGRRPGFAQLDVDAVAQGAPFLFGSGLVSYNPFQREYVLGLGGEAGVVRATLRQQLLIPASARLPGLFGADWRTDLVARNPGPETVQVTVRYLPNPRTSAPAEDALLSLEPNTIAVVPDVLGSLFHLGQGSGALLLVPNGGGSIQATSRSDTASQAGRYGMSVDAVERVEAAGPGFPLTFSAGLLGPGFRSNLVATDATGRGSELDLVLSTGAGPGEPALAVRVPENGQTQLSGLSDWMGVPATQTAALGAVPRSGRTAAGAIAIDNRTNDPSWFPPDILGTTMTTSVIPAVVHADGANGARFRTDLFLSSVDESPNRTELVAWPWETAAGRQTLELTLQPGEHLVLEDVLFSAFGLTGVARLQVGALSATGSGVRVTSRTYTVQPDGSTYGMQLPPLDATQTAGAGEALEILGPTGGANTRTNLSLVELGSSNPGDPSFGPPVTAQIEILDENGTRLDVFEVKVPQTGGLQINDLFRKRGLGAGPRAALLRISPAGGLLCAYATTVDNATNDPVYFAGNLAP
jgi:hypothetical protein